MIKRLMILGFVVGFALLLYAPPGMTYSTYSGSSGASNCANPSCHGDFREGSPSNHSVHVGGSDMTTNCNLCHYGNGETDEKPVYIGESGETPDYSCTGCHQFAGLLARHDGISGCGCHNPFPTPEPESTLPAYYGRTDVALENPCRIGKTNGGEDFSGDGQGLDNDGDGLYDGNDPDCAGVSSPENTWGAMKAIYGSE